MRELDDLMHGRARSALAHALTFLSCLDVGELAAVSTSFNALSSHDAVWRELYSRRFGDMNAEGGNNFKRGHQERLRDPAINDVVEVAWRGKFHLDAEHVFVGLSWWIATVVDKNACAGYKVRFSGWNMRWDEWVRPERIRWPSRFLSGPARAAGTARGEVVEVWCHGEGVGGAWLEARVRKTTRSAVCLTDMAVVSSERLWVTNDRICRRCDIPKPLCRSPDDGGSARAMSRSRRLVRQSVQTLGQGVRGVGSVVKVAAKGLKAWVLA